MKTVVYGSWHLAEVYATGLCMLGHEIVLVSDEDTYNNYIKFKLPVFEPGILENIKKYTKKNKFSFSSSIDKVKIKTDTCFFAQDCVMTRNGVDLKDIEEHFNKVVKSNLFETVIVSSQVPVGTCRKWQNRYKEIDIVYFPEFLRFGDALQRFLNPDYITLGGNENVTKKVFDFFKTLNIPKFSLSLEEAEMLKHATNIFVATTVSFVSELTKFSEPFDINFENIGKILRIDKRIGTKAYTFPGLGFTGTVGRDFKVLINIGKKIGIRLPMFEQVLAVNKQHNNFIEDEIRKRFKRLKNKKIAFLGATYKPFTSNLRGSIIEPLMRTLKTNGAHVVLYDPMIESSEYEVSSIEDAFSAADAVVITVVKEEFKRSSYKNLVDSMRCKVIIDAANMFKKDDAKKLKVDYTSIGRGKL